MKFDDMKEAVEDAKRTQRIFDLQTKDLAGLLCGNLRNVGKGWYDIEILKKPKKELTQFNANTGEWKS